MRPNKHRNDDSQDQFEEIKEEVETVAARNFDSPPKSTLKNHPRLHYLAEKHKLGFVPAHETPALPVRSQPKKEGAVGVGKIIKVGSATFRSNFQSGSLGGVEIIGSNSFRITLDPETNSSRSNNWFDFIVEGVKGEANFTITGYRKRTSLFSEGMRVCCRELAENKWKRGGNHISYVKEETEGKREVKFSYIFKQGDQSGLEFAYCFPYTLSKLQQFIASIHSKAKVQTITSSFQGIDIPLINMGNFSSKEVVVLSARVHPGQTVSSFIMEGFLKQLASDSEPARFLKERFLFKIMPMINVDGVRHGNFRFCASGVDLNRRWKEPSQEHHPEIYYLKQMILREGKQKNVRMYIDMHGHSRKKNVFFYGCCREGQDIQENFYPKAFPFLMSKIHEPFSYQDCSFTIQPDKEGTARVALWNQLKINQIYTLEASFCSSAKANNYHEIDYQQMGHKLCEGMALYFYESSQKYSHLFKAISFREKVYSQLRSDVSLLKQGNEQNSGSDSEPQKGQHHQKEKEKDKDKIVINIRQETNYSTNGRRSQNGKYNKPKEQPRYKEMSQYSARQKTSKQSKTLIPPSQILPFKHKSEADMLDEPIQIQPEHLNTLFPPLVPNRITETERQKISQEKNKNTLDVNRNIRVHQPIKGNSVPVTKLTLYTDEQPSNEEDPQKKDKRIISAFQNTQYRRIKNMVEQRFTEKWQQETPPSLVQSINARKMEAQQRPQGVAPRFYNTPMKRRKNSTQVFYNKASKSVGKGATKDMNVMCRGRQIMF